MVNMVLLTKEFTMKTKAKNYLLALVLLIALLFANLFPLTCVRANAQTYSDDGFALYASNVTSETITFTSRETEYSETKNGVPLYFLDGDLPNGCGAAAGAIVLGFHDKYHEDLIPNFTSYFPATGKYKINDKTYIPALMRELFTLMRTNVDDVGVSEEDCLDGLSSYIHGKNHSVAYNTIASSSKFSASRYLSEINSNRPVLLFSKAMDIYSFSVANDYELLIKNHISTNHVYVGYGYYTIRYYNGSSNFRTDTYLRVATGWAALDYAFIHVSSTASNVTNSWFENGYGVSIT